MNENDKELLNMLLDINKNSIETMGKIPETIQRAYEDGRKKGRWQMLINISILTVLNMLFNFIFNLFR